MEIVAHYVAKQLSVRNAMTIKQDIRACARILWLPYAYTHLQSMFVCAIEVRGRTDIPMCINDFCAGGAFKGIFENPTNWA